MATKIFLENGIDPSNHHTKFETFFGSTVDFIKILEVSEFPIGLYCGWHISANRNTNLWEIHSLLGFL